MNRSGSEVIAPGLPNAANHGTELAHDPMFTIAVL